MPKQNEFCDYLMDRLGPLGQPSYRFMFGGCGIYLDGLMVGIVVNDVLLLRADGGNRPDYEKRGIGPFRPYPEKMSSTMPYYTVPDDVFEDQDAFQEWAPVSRGGVEDPGGKGNEGKTEREAGRHPPVAPVRQTQPLTVSTGIRIR